VQQKFFLLAWFTQRCHAPRCFYGKNPNCSGKTPDCYFSLVKAKTAFFSNVSHEFRTPLTLMLGPLQDLLSGSHSQLSPDATQQFELVNRNGARLMRLVDTLLDFSRIEAGRVHAVYQATDLAAFTAELAGVFRAATDRAGLELNVSCRTTREVAYVDRDIWEKIVPEPDLQRLQIHFRRRNRRQVAQVGHSAELRVRDSGVGIPSEEIPHLFERFHRVPNLAAHTKAVESGWPWYMNS
jgi:signal transduction histidine kinase